MNQILSAIKNLPRRGQHNLAKIVCLGFGLSVSAVLIGEVYFEQTVETWFPGHERTYRARAHLHHQRGYRAERTV